LGTTNASTLLVADYWSVQAGAQLVAMLKEARSGVPVADLLRKHRVVGKATFFKWRNYGGAVLSDVKPSRELEFEKVKLEKVRTVGTGPTA